MNVLQHEQVGDIKALNTRTRPCSWQWHKHTSFSVKQADELINSPKYQEPVDPRSDMPTNVKNRVWAETKCAHFVTRISKFWDSQTIHALNHFDPFMAVIIFIEGISFSFTPFIPISFYYNVFSLSHLFSEFSPVPDSQSVYIPTPHFSPPSSPHPPPSFFPCARHIPLSYSFFRPKDISPPTRASLIPLYLSIYLYQ